jgi:aminoglycoside 6-adenylyltransferase
MKTYDEMYDLILKTAQEDDRIRAMTMEGSNVTKGAVHDAFSDFDVTFFVSDIREFTSDKDYMKRFGDILILQTPDDYYEEPYDYNGKERFAFLTQYKDGNRIDLTFIDISKIKNQIGFEEPRTVLINKDNFPELKDITSNEVFFIQKPSKFEFFNTVNEFRWVSNYATKGLCRHEFFYAKRVMELYMMDMFMKMINWKVGIDNDFKVTTGANSKYLKNFMTKEEMKRFEGIFAGGDYEDMWNKLFLMYDYFEELSIYVSKKLGFPIDLEESQNVRSFMEDRHRQFKTG